MEAEDLHPFLCDITGEPMSDGFIFGELSDKYIANEKDAIAYAKKLGYKTLQDSYDDDMHYWTTFYEDVEELGEGYDNEGRLYIRNEQGEFIKQ